MGCSNSPRVLHVIHSNRQASVTQTIAYAYVCGFIPASPHLISPQAYVGPILGDT